MDRNIIGPTGPRGVVDGPGAGIGGGYPPAPDAAPAAAEGPSDRRARNLAETGAVMFMYTSMGGLFTDVDALAYKKYRDRLVADCGAPSDPVEVMLIEQLALAHLNAGRLHYRAASAEGLDGAKVYGSLAVLLRGELRRTALALKAYRAAAGPRGVVADDQEGVSSGLAGSRGVSGPKSRRRRTG